MMQFFFRKLVGRAMTNAVAIAVALVSTDTVQAMPAALTQKLDRQWRLYSAAQSALVGRQNLPLDQQTISRDEWEAHLALPAQFAFTVGDIETLQADQAARVAQARRRAQQSSRIDLRGLQTPAQIAKFCADLPKGGMLHIHPFGALTRATARALLLRNPTPIVTNEILASVDRAGGNEDLSASERADLAQIPSQPYATLPTAQQDRLWTFLFLPLGRQSFARFNAVFEFLGLAIHDTAAYLQTVTEFAAQARREGVDYVEFTTGVSSGFLSIVSQAEQVTGLTIRVNDAFDRLQSAQDLATGWRGFQQSPEARDPHIVGIDLLDNEDGNPALEKGQLLYGAALAAKTLHRTMHAGEIGDRRNPRDAMILGAERLGHGVNLAKDPVALEFAALRHEPVEVNISSNLRLTEVTSAGTHPYLTYLRLGLPVSLSTDDEGIFDIDINHECELAVSQTDVTYAELKQMAINGLETSFAAPADRQRLRTELEQKFRAFELAH